MAIKEIKDERYKGSEIEFGYRKSKNRGSSIVSFNSYPKDIGHIGHFQTNGSKMYVDLNLIEYATPECRTLAELVEHEIAGEELASEAYGGEIISLHKRSISPELNNSTGAHENYSTTIDVANNQDPIITYSLATHLATRTVFTGAGKNKKDSISPGQKMMEIYHFRGRGSSSDKALINTKMEHHTENGSLYKRLHVICGDANISPWAIYMKFGTTSLVLRLLEEKEDLNGLILKNPLGSARDIADSIEAMNIPREIFNSKKKFTALDIQESMAEKAQALSERIELPREEAGLIKEWFGIIHALKRYISTGDPQPEMKQLDWYTKIELIKKAEDRQKGVLSPIQRRLFDLKYDQVPDGLGYSLRKTRFSAYTPDRERIIYAKQYPPEGRAKLRGTLITKALANIQSDVAPHSAYHTDWEIFLRNSPYKKIDLPLTTYSNEEIEQITAGFFDL
jgi:proteasome accessory factor A